MNEQEQKLTSHTHGATLGAPKTREHVSLRQVSRGEERNDWNTKKFQSATKQDRVTIARVGCLFPLAPALIAAYCTTD